MRVPNVGCAAAALMLLPAVPARAADSYDTCAGFITSLPATISTQGTWCMNRDMATSLASGAAITIKTNNVTIDCNDFKLSGLAAGAGSQTHGIHAYGKVNATVRNCMIRGFNRGVFLEGTAGGGHVVEDSRFEGNLVVGLHVDGEGSLIRRNLVIDSGGLTGSTSSAGILGNGADIHDNTVNGVSAAGSAQYTFGIIGNGFGAVVANNSVRNVVSSNGYSTGISTNGPAATVRGNAIANPAGVSGGSPQSGINAGGPATEGFCIDNTVAGYSTPLHFCHELAGNQTRP
jgi:hypothetical protein